LQWIGIASKETGSSSEARSRSNGGHLTDDDLDKIAGKREQPEGKIQERAGITKDAARKSVDDWLNKQWSSLDAPERAHFECTVTKERKADHIAESYESRGVPEKEAERIAWATVNKESGRGKKSGSGRGQPESHASSQKGGRLGGQASARRPAAERSAAAKKAAATRERRASSWTPDTMIALIRETVPRAWNFAPAPLTRRE
jgi:uncharacterized protein YjbJ (UPF0337 family)